MLRRITHSYDFRGKETKLHWELDEREMIDRDLMLHGVYERNSIALYESLIQVGDTVLDIGANIGAHTLPLALLVGPSGQVHAVEPSPWAFDRLRNHCAINALTQVHCHQIALSDRNAKESTAFKASWWPAEKSRGGAPRNPLSEKPSLTQIRTLSQFVRETNLINIDFMKVDVDASAEAFFRGAQEVIARHRPTLLLEWGLKFLSDSGAQQFSFLTSCGYSLSPLCSSSNGHSLQELTHTLEETGEKMVLGLPDS